jgi:hypothetical protein
LEVQSVLTRIFERRNKPGSCRVDNGDPFGAPAHDTPPVLALWLIGYDIDMIWNKPYCPQMNGVVEKMQDTSQRWAEIETALSYQDLQEKLDKQALIQRQHFPVSRLAQQTRLQAFPNLEKSNRQWIPENFNCQRVYDFLAQKTFSRKVSIAGQLNHCGQKISGLAQFKEKIVQIKLEPQKMEWVVYCDYKVIKNYSALPALSQNRILNLSIFQ